MKTQENKAIAYLMLLCAIWGLTFPLIKMSVATVDPLVFVTTRFALSAVILLLLCFSYIKRASKEEIIIGLILGILSSLTYSGQTIGIATISASKAAFITGLNAMFVPIILPLFKLRKPNIIEIICVTCSLIGLYILTGADLQHLSSGDAWVLFAAIIWAFMIVYLQKASVNVHNVVALTFYQILFTIPLTAFASIGKSYLTLMVWSPWPGIIFCAVFATCLSMFLQIKYQRHTTATKAALIFSLEPVYGALFSWLLLNDVLQAHMLLGGIIIFVSGVLPWINWQAIYQRRPKQIPL